MAWNSDPVVRALANVAAKAGDGAGLYIGFRTDGRLNYVSYGCDGRMCRAAAKMLDQIADRLGAGRELPSSLFEDLSEKVVRYAPQAPAPTEPDL